MARCIFCDSEGNSFNREEHLIPESLGGEIILPQGLVCDKCNNYFGHSVEKKALDSPPISFLRAMLSVQNKRRKFHHHVGLNWEVEGSNSDASFIFPDSRLRSLIRLGRGQIRIPLNGMESICRLMLKMGVECLSMSIGLDVFDNQFLASRRAARAPQLGTKWSMAVSHFNPNQLGIYHYSNNKIESFDEIIYDIDLAFDQDFGMIGIQFIYGWMRLVIPLNDIGLKYFDQIVFRHNFLRKDENEFAVYNLDITKLA